MTMFSNELSTLRSLDDRLARAAEESRPTFTDATRPGFDLHIVNGMSERSRELGARISELERSLADALRLLG